MDSFNNQDYNDQLQDRLNQVNRYLSDLYGGKMSWQQAYLRQEQDFQNRYPAYKSNSLNNLHRGFASQGLQWGGSGESEQTGKLNENFDKLEQQAREQEAAYRKRCRDQINQAYKQQMELTKMQDLQKRVESLKDLKNWLGREGGLNPQTSGILKSQAAGALSPVLSDPAASSRVKSLARQYWAGY